MIAYEVKVSVFKYFFRHENIQFAFEAKSIKFEMPTHFSSSVFFFHSRASASYTRNNIQRFGRMFTIDNRFLHSEKKYFFSAGIFCRGCVLNIILVMKHHLYLYIFVSSCYKIYENFKKMFLLKIMFLFNLLHP